MDWQPIETAPKDGLALVGGVWDDGSHWWNIGTCFKSGVLGDWCDDVEPIYWMPLPPLPSPPSQERL